MIEYINSPLFGRIEKPDEKTEKVIEELTEKYPTIVFQKFNKKLNSKNLQSLICPLDKEGECLMKEKMKECEIS